MIDCDYSEALAIFLAPFAQKISQILILTKSENLICYFLTNIRYLTVIDFTVFFPQSKRKLISEVFDIYLVKFQVFKKWTLNLNRLAHIKLDPVALRFHTRLVLERGPFPAPYP